MFYSVLMTFVLHVGFHFIYSDDVNRVSIKVPLFFLSGMFNYKLSQQYLPVPYWIYYPIQK